jgi:hypothetical protein
MFIPQQEISNGTSSSQGRAARRWMQNTCAMAFKQDSGAPQGSQQEYFAVPTAQQHETPFPANETQVGISCSWSVIDKHLHSVTPWEHAKASPLSSPH